MASISHRDKDGGVIYRTIETERIVVDLFRGSQSGMTAAALDVLHSYSVCQGGALEKRL